MERRVRIQEVAREAGISVAAASYALRGDRHVGEATRRRVEEVALRLGYRRNAAAALLARQRGAGASQLLVGWVTGLPVEDRSYWGPWVPIHRRWAEARGWSFVHANLTDEAEARRANRLFRDLGVEAVVHARTAPGRSPLPLAWDRFVCVGTERMLREHGFDVVRANHFLRMFELLEVISGCGYRRIAVWGVESLQQTPDDLARRGAVELFQQRPQRGRVCAYVANANERFVKPGAVRRFLKQHRPDAILGFQHFHLELLHGAGVEVPGEVGFVALHLPAGAVGNVAGVLDREEVHADYAFDLLEQKWQARRYGLSERPMELVYPLKFEPGPTLPRRPR